MTSRIPGARALIARSFNEKAQSADDLTLENASSFDRGFVQNIVRPAAQQILWGATEDFAAGLAGGVDFSGP